MAQSLYRSAWIIIAVLALAAAASAQQPIGELFATDAGVKGSVVLAGSGTGVMSGSAIEAGQQTATLKLERGGSLLVCPGTKLTVTASQNGRQLLLSLNSGSLELDYLLGTAADTVLTPDLRLLMPGPGRLHAAVRIDHNGDTCVQSLSSNATGIVASEAFGDATYEVKPQQTVMFQGGRIAGAVAVRTNCGCVTPPPIQVARMVPPPAPPTPSPTAAPMPSLQPVSKPKSEVAAQPLPIAGQPSPAPEQPITVQAVPFVFRGDEPALDMVPIVATLREGKLHLIQFETVVIPPPERPAMAASRGSGGQKHGFFSKLKAFFAAIFRG